MVDDDDTVFSALAAGARGYVLKGASADEITAALRTVAAGGAVFGAGIASQLLAKTPARLSGPAPISQQHDLTGTCGDRLNPLSFSVTNVFVKKPDSTENLDGRATPRAGPLPVNQAESPPVTEGAFRRRTVGWPDPHSVWRNDARSR